MGIFELGSLGFIKACVNQAGRFRDGVLVMKEQDALHSDCQCNSRSHGDLAMTHSNGPIMYCPVYCLLFVFLAL